VYLITNTVNGKIYVGKTIGSVAIRWQYHYHNAAHKKSKSIALWNAIRKYGKDSFKVEEITEAEEPELSLLEKKYIAELRANDSSIGYNMTIGGDGASPGYKPTPEVRQKISKALIGKRLGIKLSEETKRRISVGTSKGQLGRVISEETKEKIRQSLLGRKFSDERKKAVSEGVIRAYEKNYARQRGLA